MYYGKELERIQKGNRIERIWEDCNGFLNYQYKIDGEDEQYNDGWHTIYTSQCCITVHKPYPYKAPSNYYYKRNLGYSVEEALA